MASDGVQTLVHATVRIRPERRAPSAGSGMAEMRFFHDPARRLPFVVRVHAEPPDSPSFQYTVAAATLSGGLLLFEGVMRREMFRD